MKACIVGAGALGSIFSYYFSRNNLDFIIYEKDERVTEAVKHYLTVEAEGRLHTLHPEISSDPSSVGGCELIFLFVKSYSTEQAMKDVAAYSDKDSVIVSIQNGLGNYEVISSVVESSRIVYGTTTIGAAKTAPSSVKAGGMGKTIIGCRTGNGAHKAAEFLRLAGLETDISDNPEHAVWEKAIINAGINPIASLLGLKNGQIPENKYASILQENVIRETVEVARSKGIEIDPEIMIARTRDVCVKTSENICSMFQDIELGRKTEIESINGRIADYGEENHVQAISNRTMYLLIKAREKSRREY